MSAQPAEPLPGAHKPDCCCQERAEIAEEFDVYRSGAALTLLHLPCRASKPIVGRIRLAALNDEALAHADMCAGRDA